MRQPFLLVDGSTVLICAVNEGRMRASKAVSTALLVALAGAGTGLSAQRASSPAEATVFIRLIGSAHVEVEDQGNRRAADLNQVEIGSGSGFVVSPSGYVLTNHHVVGGGTIVENRNNAKVTITTRVARIDVCLSPDAARAQGSATPCTEASVYASDPDRDLAVLFVSANLPYLALGDSDAVSRGQPVQALGYPLGTQVEVGRADAAPGLVPEISVVEGTVAALREGDAGQPRYLQVTSNLNPGNSGGPLVDDAGFVVGVVSMKIRGASGIGFAIPINDAKNFLETRGLDQLMPTRQLRLGPFESVPGKNLGLRLPVGLQDVTQARSRVETDARESDVVLRVDRVFTPWTPKQVEQSLVATQQFERFSAAGHRSQTVTPAAGTPRLVGRATGTAVDSDQPLRVDYSVVDLGLEVLVARYVGSEEALAFNASVLRASLASLEGQGLLSSSLPALPILSWTALPAGNARDTVPVPAGWPVEAGAPGACRGLPEPAATGAVMAPGDFTVTLRLAHWPTGIDPHAASAACASRRGALGPASYSTGADSLGVRYVIEGVFVRTSSGSAVQAEVVSPDSKAVFARALLAAWAARAGEAP